MKTSTKILLFVAAGILLVGEVLGVSNITFTASAPFFINNELVRDIYTSDISGSASKEILIASGENKFYVFNSNGTKLWEYSDFGEINVVYADDINRDGSEEIIVGGGSYKDPSYGVIYVFDASGDKIWEYRFSEVIHENRTENQTGETPFARPSEYIGQLRTPVTAIKTADIKGDGRKYIVAGTAKGGGGIYVIAPNKELLLNVSLSGGVKSMDVDKKGNIVAGCEVQTGMASISGEVVMFDSSGNKKLSVKTKTPVNHVMFTDLDDNGVNEIVASSEFQGYMYNYAGELKWTLQDSMDTINEIDVMDLDGDTNEEVVFGSSDKHLYALTRFGNTYMNPIIGKPVTALNHIIYGNEPVLIVGGSKGEMFIVDREGRIIKFISPDEYHNSASRYISRIVIDDIDPSDSKEDVIICSTNVYRLQYEKNTTGADGGNDPDKLFDDAKDNLDQCEELIGGGDYENAISYCETAKRYAALALGSYKKNEDKERCMSMISEIESKITVAKKNLADRNYLGAADMLDSGKKYADACDYDSAESSYENSKQYLLEANELYQAIGDTEGSRNIGQLMDLLTVYGADLDDAKEKVENADSKVTDAKRFLGEKKCSDANKFANDAKGIYKSLNCSSKTRECDSLIANIAAGCTQINVTNGGNIPNGSLSNTSWIDENITFVLAGATIMVLFFVFILIVAVFFMKKSKTSPPPSPQSSVEKEEPKDTGGFGGKNASGTETEEIPGLGDEAQDEEEKMKKMEEELERLEKGENR